MADNNNMVARMLNDPEMFDMAVDIIHNQRMDFDTIVRLVPVPLCNPWKLQKAYLDWVAIQNNQALVSKG